MSLDPRDEILQTVCPTVMVPRFTPFDLLQGPGHRFLTAADGLWLEVRRKWLHLVYQLCGQTDVRMPYGELQQSVEFSFGRVPEDLIQRFLFDAQLAHPHECGAWLIFDELTEKLEYRRLHTLSARHDHLEVERPPLLPHEHLAVDLHSHGGDIPAFFSSEDDKDDAGEVKISIVFGKVTSAEISVEMRLCALGLFIPL